jgi:flagellar biosynthetic protein FliP
MSAGQSTPNLALPEQLPDLMSRRNLAQAIQAVVLLTVLSLAPAILVLCTSFTRIIIVLSLLRQALGTQNLPPNQVLAGLSLFMTCIVMAPTWKEINAKAVQPYINGEISQQEALAQGVRPLRDFMCAQIDAAENGQTVLVFHEYSRQEIPEDREVTWGDVSTATLIPAFVLSELKVAFLMGFKVYLPFLVIDLIISAVLASMGMLMLPPVLVSLPFKLLLFVLVDGWTLIAAGLMGSFVIASG